MTQGKRKGFRACVAQQYRERPRHPRAIRKSVSLKKIRGGPSGTVPADPLALFHYTRSKDAISLPTPSVFVADSPEKEQKETREQVRSAKKKTNKTKDDVLLCVEIVVSQLSANDSGR